MDGCIMSQPAQPQVILADHDVLKVVLPSGIPDTVDNLQSVICDTFSIARDFSLHDKDIDFGEFFILFFLQLTSRIRTQSRLCFSRTRGLQ